MSRTTWTMVHMLGDRLIEEWMGHRIRDLSRHYIINILWILNFVLLIQKDKKMYVRQSPLLKFNSINHASHFTKQTAPDIFEKLFHLLVTGIATERGNTSCREPSEWGSNG